MSCARRAFNLPPKSPLKRLTPTSLRQKSRHHRKASLSVTLLNFGDGKDDESGDFGPNPADNGTDGTGMAINASVDRQVGVHGHDAPPAGMKYMPSDKYDVSNDKDLPDDDKLEAHYNFSAIGKEVDEGVVATPLNHKLPSQPIIDDASFLVNLNPKDDGRPYFAPNYVKITDKEKQIIIDHARHYWGVEYLLEFQLQSIRQGIFLHNTLIFIAAKTVYGKSITPLTISSIRKVVGVIILVH